jgi:branched-chain amino acid transport system ATP-binding protein
LEPSAPHLELMGLRAGYGGPDILTGVDLQIGKGEFVAILGPNGAGKSTLLRTLFGLTKVTAGSLAVFGQRVDAPSPAAMLKHGIAYVPQGRCNFPLMSIAENLELAAYSRRDREEVRCDLDYVRGRFPILVEKRKALASHLSGGQQQVLELAMALLRRPKLLLIDEPSMGLAPAAVTAVFNELSRLQTDGLTILLVEQNTKRALEVAYRAVVLRLGKVLWTGPAQGVSHNELADMFLTGETGASRPDFDV